jgi:hypothetical protein
MHLFLIQINLMEASSQRELAQRINQDNNVNLITLTKYISEKKFLKTQIRGYKGKNF